MTLTTVANLNCNLNPHDGTLTYMSPRHISNVLVIIFLPAPSSRLYNTLMIMMYAKKKMYAVYLVTVTLVTLTLTLTTVRWLPGLG